MVALSDCRVRRYFVQGMIDAAMDTLLEPSPVRVTHPNGSRTLWLPFG
jgi:hypothetical protein